MPSGRKVQDGFFSGIPIKIRLTRQHGTGGASDLVIMEHFRIPELELQGNAFTHNADTVDRVDKSFHPGIKEISIKFFLSSDTSFPSVFHFLVPVVITRPTEVTQFLFLSFFISNAVDDLNLIAPAFRTVFNFSHWTLLIQRGRSIKDTELSVHWLFRMHGTCSCNPDCVHRVPADWQSA